MWYIAVVAVVLSTKVAFQATALVQPRSVIRRPGTALTLAADALASPIDGPPFSSDNNAYIDATTTAETAAPATPHPEDENVNLMPSSLSPTYKALPVWLKLVLVGVSFSTTTLMTTTRRPVAWKQVVSVWSSWRVVPHFPRAALQWVTLDNFSWRSFIRLVLKIVLLYAVLYAALQDVLPTARFRPSRVDTAELVARKQLPSVLSRYGRVGNNHATNTNGRHNVHWIEMATTSPNKTAPFDAVYVNHGFGASSLSWLPVLPSLGQRLSRYVVLGHDAPGFGFTDRPRVVAVTNGTDLPYYSIENSAVMAGTLLQEALNRRILPPRPEALSSGPKPSVLLLGHSMGCLTTLHMATQLNRTSTTQLRIVLVAPLGLRPTSKRGNSFVGRIRPVLAVAIRTLGVVVTPIVSYLLRRLVGLAGFWRTALGLAAWSDKRRLRSSDVLRYQWPSIGKGWEQGLIQFTLARVNGGRRPHAKKYYTSDQELLRAVLALPIVASVHVIVASKDRIAPAKRVREFLKDFPQVEIVEMEGLGHVPFEEDADTFMGTLLSILTVR